MIRTTIGSYNHTMIRLTIGLYNHKMVRKIAACFKCFVQQSGDSYNHQMILLQTLMVRYIHHMIRTTIKYNHHPLIFMYNHPMYRHPMVHTTIQLLVQP